MNLLEQVGGLIVVVCTLGGFYLKVRDWVAQQRAAELRAFRKAQKKTRRQGYDERTEEIRPVIDRVIGVLDGVYTAIDNPAEIRRRIGSAMTELRDAREGEEEEPDDD